jgi:hypothetical protein
MTKFDAYGYLRHQKALAAEEADAQPQKGVRLLWWDDESYKAYQAQDWSEDYPCPKLTLDDFWAIFWLAIGYADEARRIQDMPF